MGRLIILFGLLISPLFGVVEAQIDSCLPSPKNGTFVYDNADLLTQGEEVDIQNVLRSFVDSTSNVIVVVTHPDFCGYNPSTFAIETGDRLGVGRSDLDNGVVIAIKPRNNSGKGQIFIAIGEGLEGAIPDILTGRIVDSMIPYFKNANWSGGLENGIKQIMGLSSGEFTEADYMRNNGTGDPEWPIVMFVMFLVFIMPVLVIMIAVKNQMRKNSGSSWITSLIIVLADMNRQNNSYKNFKRGRRGFSGGGFRSGNSGFGGFGGGSFGGGGAGGSF